MTRFEVTVPFKEGLHARPAVKLIKIVKKFNAVVILEKDGENYPADSITSVLSACITYGQTITVCVDGPDEASACSALKEYFTPASDSPI